jgi:hypothetical protein
MFEISNIDVGDGLLAATSDDGGVTWSRRLIASASQDTLPPACCDPSAAFDSFGNLFVTYLSSDTNQILVLQSTDAGHSFTLLGKFRGDVDQPTIVTGPGSVWVTFEYNSSMAATGAPVTGLGTVGSFQPLQKIRGTGGGNFGDVAIGSSGQVIVTYQKQLTKTSSKVFVSVDSDGLGPAKFGAPILATTTHLGAFDFIDAQFTRGIDAEAGLAFDRSGGPFNGRIYLVYVDETPAASGNTDVMLRYSDNGGSVWSNPIRVNDDTGGNSQFQPRISLDQSTGQLGVSWYDARDDHGDLGPGDTDKLTNDDVQFFATVIVPQTNGVLVAANQLVSAGVSNAADSNNSIDLGDYSGLDFFGGTLHPLWFDNSDSTADNKDGLHHALEAYTASVPASAFPLATAISLGGLTDPAGPVASLPFSAGANPGFIKKGNSYTVTVAYTDADGVSSSSIANTNLSITGPNGFSATAEPVRVKPRKGGAVVATYLVTNSAGNWSDSDAGVYTIKLQPNQILDSRSRPSAGGILGSFTVAIGLKKESRGGGGGSRHHGDPDEH